MKLKDINLKTFKPLRDLVGFKWIKVDGIAKNSLIVLPDTINDGGGEGRMGHKYTCEALVVGPNTHVIKPGNRFLLHEYDKVDQAIPWSEEEVMFAEEGVIKLLLDKDAEAFMSQAKVITEKMIEEYEEY